MRYKLLQRLDPWSTISMDVNLLDFVHVIPFSQYSIDILSECFSRHPKGSNMNRMNGFVPFGIAGIHSLGYRYQRNNGFPLGSQVNMVFVREDIQRLRSFLHTLYGHCKIIQR